MALYILTIFSKVKKADNVWVADDENDGATLGTACDEERLMVELGSLFPQHQNLSASLSLCLRLFLTPKIHRENSLWGFRSEIEARVNSQSWNREELNNKKYKVGNVSEIEYFSMVFVCSIRKKYKESHYKLIR